MEKCRFCSCEKVIKNGFIQGKQRFKCKQCGKNQLESDGREKYDKKTKYLAISMRIYGSGLRQIANTLTLFTGQKVYYQTIDKWIKNDYKIIENQLEIEPKRSENIAIVEMDELYTWIKKNQKLPKNTENGRQKCEFGLLFLETKIVLLRLSSLRD